MTKIELSLEERTTAYNECEKIIWAIVNRFAANSQFERDELYGVAVDKFLRVVDDYDPARGAKLTTYIQFRVSNGLRTYMSRRGKKLSHEVLWDDFSENGFDPVGQSNRATILESVEEMSTAAQTLAKLVLDPPALLIDEVATPHQFRKSLKQYVSDVLGWSLADYKKAFKEAQEFITNHSEVGADRMTHAIAH